MEKLVKQSLNRLFGSWKWPKNWVLKLLSLFFAVFLWYFVAGEDNVDMTVKVPVEVINLPQNLIIANEYKNELEVLVSGPRGIIRDMLGSVSRTINLSTATEGPVIIKNDNKSIPTPWGVKVLRTKPSEIILQLDKLVDKKLAIQAVTTGQVPKGYNLVSILLEPPEITITASEAIIGKENIINTLPLDINGLTGPTTVHTSLELAPKISRLIGHPVVTAHILIEEKQVPLSLKDIAVTIPKTSTIPGMTISPEQVAIQASIPYSLAQTTTDYASLFTVTITAAGLQPGTHRLKVLAKPAEGVKILEITPPEVTVTVPPGAK